MIIRRGSDWLIFTNIFDLHQLFVWLDREVLGLLNNSELWWKEKSLNTVPLQTHFVVNCDNSILYFLKKSFKANVKLSIIWVSVLIKYVYCRLSMISLFVQTLRGTVLWFLGMKGSIKQYYDKVFIENERHAWCWMQSNFNLALQ